VSSASTASRTLDVSDLPEAVLDSRSLVWWGTLVMTTIETMVFALTIGAYFYLRMISPQWPPPRIGPPGLLAATINLAVLLVSAVPAVWLDRAARRRDKRTVTRMLIANLVFGTVFLALRYFEFLALHGMWNADAYESVNWTILGLHTSNVLTSLIETFIVLVYFLTKKVEDRHFLYARLDGVFWYFIVISWIPLYAVVFLAPRLR